MNKSQAQTSIVKVAAESSKLDPSALITLYEIDITDIAENITLQKSNIEIDPQPFRFHNMNNLKGIALKFQTNNYISFPIETAGFEMNSVGSLPTPTLTMTSIEGLDQENSAFALLKKDFIHLENFVGAKVTRIRTFAKFLDLDQNGDTIEGVGGEADVNAEFPRDVFFVERKSNENKNSIQFELSSVFDLDNLKLPSRVIYATRCPWAYRGEGCCYEYKAQDTGPTSGDNQTTSTGSFGYNAKLPDWAPPIANSSDELISGTVTGSAGQPLYIPEQIGKVTGVNYNTTGTFQGRYKTGEVYTTGDVIFIERNHIKYWFVAKTGLFDNVCPPHGIYWEPDQCSKTLKGCKLRWGTAGKAYSQTGAASGITNEYLPFGGFPGTNTRASVN